MRQIDSGGMGSVWLAEAVHLRSLVAVKVMDRAVAATPEAAQRFLHEARTAASLRSPHVVQILDYGVHESTPFIVMELLEGESLAERLQRVKRLRAPVVAQITTQIARALARAHEAGLIHRDLKPDNILLTRNDEEELVKVLDFGIAKWLGAHQSSGTLAGQMLGTPAYMSPEHFANSASIDHRADLWGLGVIAYECMTGERPFQGETLVGLALSVCNGRYTPPSRLANVPDGFDAWFARAVAQDPKHRFPSARMMAEELRGLSGHLPMLWEDSALPRQHATREKTELEPVLELTRRARGSRTPEPRPPITEIDSVLPMLRNPSTPARRGGVRWGLTVALFLGGGAAVVAAPVLRPTALDGLVTELREAVASRLERPAAPAQAAPAAPAGGVAAAPAGGAPLAVPPAAGALPQGSARAQGGTPTPGGAAAAAGSPRIGAASDRVGNAPASATPDAGVPERARDAGTR
jgi:eukaryotic-like serine/threonine-protein kinase